MDATPVQSEPPPRATPTMKARRTNARSLADVLRQRSQGERVARDERAAAMRQSLGALTRSAEGAIVDVPLEDLHPNPFQPRFHFHRQPLEELAQSLASEGQLEPAIARRVRRDGREILEIVAGARRLEAARICNATIRPFPTLRVEIRELSDEEAERLALIENLQRENLSPLEEGYRYWQLQRRDPRRWTVRAIAEFVHKKKSSVQNRLSLIKDPAVAEAVLREQIPPTAAFHILRLPPGEREPYLRTAISGGLTVEQIRLDVDRRLAILRSVDGPERDARPVSAISVPAAAGDPAPCAPPGAGAAQPVAVRARLRRAGPSEDEAMRALRRARLERQQREIRARIEALEEQLRAEFLALRAVERELAGLER